MLKDFFGFYPQIDGESVAVRNNFQFDGKLHHVFYKNEYYSIEYKSGKPVMTKEKIQ